MEETQWLDADEHAAWLALAAMLFTLPTALDSQLQRDAELSLGDYMVLAMLSEHQQSLRMSELAIAAGTSQSRLSRIVARLEKDGFVTRAMAGDDRRAVVATLTGAGRVKISEAAPVHVETVRKLVFDRLDRTQIDALGAIGRAILGRPLPIALVPDRSRSSVAG